MPLLVLSAVGIVGAVLGTSEREIEACVAAFVCACLQVLRLFPTYMLRDVRMMIFILQSVWVYISELAGKDLEIVVVLKFLLYVSPRIVVLVLPLTILLASIMVFGGFSENYEFAAMKSTGISLQRAMKSLSVFIVFLAVISFFFANSVIPFAEFNFYSLRRNIAKVKPAMAIAEGQFNQWAAATS